MKSFNINRRKYVINLQLLKNNISKLSVYIHLTCWLKNTLECNYLNVCISLKVKNLIKKEM